MGQITGHCPMASSPHAPAKYIRSDTTATCQKDSPRPTLRFAELAGGKTAECAAICCCCPFGLIGLVIFAVVRLPAGLCHRALRKRILLWRSKNKARLLSSGSSSGWNSESSSGSGSDNRSSGSSDKIGSATDEEIVDFARFRSSFVVADGSSWPVTSPSAELIQLEKDVWSKVCSSGFWRSPSQREELLTPQATDL